MAAEPDDPDAPSGFVGPSSLMLFLPPGGVWVALIAIPPDNASTIRAARSRLTPSSPRLVCAIQQTAHIS